MSAAKGVKMVGKMQVGQGKVSPAYFATVIAPYGNTDKVDIGLASDDRHVSLTLDRESAIALAHRILDELKVIK